MLNIYTIILFYTFLFIHCLQGLQSVQIYKALVLLLLCNCFTFIYFVPTNNKYI